MKVTMTDENTLTIEFDNKQEKLDMQAVMAILRQGGDLKERQSFFYDFSCKAQIAIFDAICRENEGEVPPALITGTEPTTAKTRRRSTAAAAAAAAAGSKEDGND